MGRCRGFGGLGGVQGVVGVQGLQGPEVLRGIRVEKQLKTQKNQKKGQMAQGTPFGAGPPQKGEVKPPRSVQHAAQESTQGSADIIQQQSHRQMHYISQSARHATKEGCAQPMNDTLFLSKYFSSSHAVVQICLLSHPSAGSSPSRGECSLQESTSILQLRKRAAAALGLRDLTAMRHLGGLRGGIAACGWGQVVRATLLGQQGKLAQPNSWT